MIQYGHTKKMFPWRYFYTNVEKWCHSTWWLGRTVFSLPLADRTKEAWFYQAVTSATVSLRSHEHRTDFILASWNSILMILQIKFSCSRNSRFSRGRNLRFLCTEIQPLPAIFFWHDGLRFPADIWWKNRSLPWKWLENKTQLKTK